MNKVEYQLAKKVYATAAFGVEIKGCLLPMFAIQMEACDTASRYYWTAVAGGPESVSALQ